MCIRFYHVDNIKLFLFSRPAIVIYLCFLFNHLSLYRTNNDNSNYCNC